MSQLKAGASRVVISPLEDMFPYPQATLNGEAMYTWVRQDIYVRGIAVDDGQERVLFLIQEMNGARNTEMIKAKITEKCNIKQENIFICATHNHSVTAPVELTERVDKWGKPIGENQLKYSAYLVEQSAQAGIEALNSMRPAKLGYGKGNSYINVSRDEQLPDGRFIFGRNFERPSDKTLYVIKLVDMEDRLIAAVLNYGVHSTMCFRTRDENGNMCVSGDLAGEIAAFVEESYKDDQAVVAWTNAAGANQTPILSFFHTYYPDGTYVPDERFNNYYTTTFMWDLCRHLGQKQGVDAVQILRKIDDYSSDVKIKQTDKLIMLPGTEVKGFGVPELKDDRLIDDSKIYNVDADALPMKLKLIEFGNLAVFGVNCEIMAEIGLRLKERSPFKETMLISHYESGGSGRYFVDKWGYENHTPSYYRNTVKDACTEEMVGDAMMEMFETLSKQ